MAYARLAFPSAHGRLFAKYVGLFVGVVCAALIANGASQILFFYQEHKSSLIRIQHEQAEAAAAKISQFINEIQTQLGWTVQLPWLDDTLQQRRTDAWRLFRQVPAVSELAQLDPSGREQIRVSRVAPDVIASGRDFSGDIKFQEAIARKQYYSEVYFRHDSEPYITLALAGDRAAGVTVAEVNLKFIWQVVSQIKVGERGTAYVVDAKGRLIAHPDISLVLSRADLSQLEQVQAVRATPPQAGVTPVQTVKDMLGRQVLSAYAPVPALDWLVFVELPSDEAHASLYATIRRTLLLLLPALALAVLAGMFLARKMVVPIQALQAGAVRIGSGDLNQRIAIETGDELESLAEQFNEMARRLQESYSDLERKVELRTSELAQSVRELHALSEITQAVNSTLDLETVLSTIVAKAVQISETDAGAIYVYDENKRELQLRATYGMDQSVIAALRAQGISGRNANIDRALEQREPVQIADITAEPPTPLRELLARASYRAFLIAPLVRLDEVVGILVVRRKEPGVFLPAVVDLLKTFAAQSAIAIHNAGLFSEIEQKSRQLEIESKHKSQFLANMSHELRTPLNAILGYAELTLDNIYGEMPDRMRRVLERIETNGRHLLGLINEVLDLSKIEAGQFSLSISEYSMTDLIESVISALEPLAQAKGLWVKVEIGAGLPRGRGDERRLAQVLLNLVGNAIKFTDTGGLTIRTSVADGWFTVAVCDTGYGISPADQGRVFGEFQQVDSSSTRKKGGTGLGLSIAKRIIEVHGGRIWVDSALGEGATFFVTIPVSVGREAGHP